MSIVGILLLTGAIVCVGLCAYGIATAVRRSKGAHAPTRR
jgi:hypothetical protein